MTNFKDIVYYLNLLVQLGLCIGVSIVLATLIGVYLDRKLNTRFIFTIIFIIFGVIGGIKGAYGLIKHAEKYAGHRKENNS